MALLVRYFRCIIYQPAGGRKNETGKPKTGIIKRVGAIKSIAMKKNIISYFLFIPLLLISVISNAQLLDRECLNANSTAQNVISSKNALFTQLSGQILTNVQSLIQQESIANVGNVLSFENLESVVSVANLLEAYDKQYDDAYAGYCEDIVQSLWSQSICVGSMTLSEYKEEMYDYLEEEKFSLVDEYASTIFAQELSFQSALLKINEEEEAWLEAVGENFDNTNPAFDQEINNELYWPVLSENWNIELRNPEPELSNVTGYSKIWMNHWEQFAKGNNHIVRGGPYLIQNTEVYDLQEILKFIFDNWDTIEKILDWLSENVTYDCHPSTASQVSNDWRAVPNTMSPERSRKIYYHVRQKGVFGDFKATKTKIEGKVKLYKKKGRRYKKDRNNSNGIGYCTLQWDPCDDRPWPVDNNPHNYPGAHGHKKARFKHHHPYALAIERSNDFLTYYLYYNQQFTGEYVHALGGNLSCE